MRFSFGNLLCMQYCVPYINCDISRHLAENFYICYPGALSASAHVEELSNYFLSICSLGKGSQSVNKRYGQKGSFHFVEPWLHMHSFRSTFLWWKESFSRAIIYQTTMPYFSFCKAFSFLVVHNVAEQSEFPGLLFKLFSSKTSVLKEHQLCQKVLFLLFSYYCRVFWDVLKACFMALFRHPTLNKILQISVILEKFPVKRRLTCKEEGRKVW